MSDCGVYLVVVGHNLEAKCDVLNALSKKEKHFDSFAFREKIEVKSSSTVNGKDILFVATPNLNTPAWSHLDEDLRSFKTKIFLYVQDNDCIDSDDNGSIEMLHDRFPEATTILFVRYNVRLREEEEDEDDPLESFPRLPCVDPVIINKRDTFTFKCAEANEVMKQLLDSLKKEEANFKGDMEVGGGKTGQPVKKLRERNVQESNSETDDDILDSVKVTKSVFTEEKMYGNLETLNSGDWTLFRKTLKLGKARSNHVRVIVVGNQGAGKTSLVKRLQKIDIKCPDEGQLPTEGLEINQVATRCTVRDGERYWEADDRGYEQELNLQRMAFALKDAKECAKEPENTNTEAVADQLAVKIAEIETGSDEIEDVGRVQKTFEYVKHVDMKQKKFYLQQVKSWKSKEDSKEERMYVSYWDFAGQSTYYATHQAFMAPSAVYVLVIDLSKDFKEKLVENLKFRTGVLKQYTIEETVKFWISSIMAYTRDERNAHAPFIIVGTHSDKVSNEAVREKVLHLRQLLKTFTRLEFAKIDNTCSAAKDIHLTALRNKILDLGLGVIDEKVPARWINLEYAILQEKKIGKGFLYLADIRELNKKSEVPVGDPSEIEAFLEHEHRRGWLMHFGHVDLKDIVILDPTLLASYFNILLREIPNHEFQSSGLVLDGRIPEDFVLEAAAEAFNVQKSDSVLGIVLKILMRLHIMYHYKENMYFVPCLLPHKEDRENLIDSRHLEKAPSIKLSFTDAFVPPAFFHLLIAALKEEECLNIYHKDGKARVYSLFCCFYFHRKTLWLEVYWHECCIFFDLKNYSTEISELNSNRMLEAISIIRNKIEHILHVYRQDNVKYTLEVECVMHPAKFVDIQEAYEDGEVMCSDETQAHCIKWECVSSFSQRKANPCEEKERVHRNQYKPNDKDLGRLARHLSRENATSLASKLELPTGNLLADRATNEYKDSTDMQRLKILCDWRNENYEQTLTKLLELLTKRKDYDRKVLTEILDGKVEHTKDYGIDCRILDTLPDDDKDLLCASECIDASYTFLMLELGLKVKDIEVKREDNQNSFQLTIFKLLEAWRQKFSTTATPRTLLDTARFLGMNTTEMVSKFKENLRM
ncbi:uncharacterized protein LOC123537399 [Mercenaria mercenaria]|uniref:uncharacterized protein LOC123537399 n=1 Tax=Mercenaria mercenaria TaxID=6596 RepID=UPI00234F77CA|nr:uncharacterized protein LOC123537399 [Mercenaria mercenaria]